ncbi:hypothetical protein PAXRUDRAFT_16314 [Paxillus rubicundulus Ve08.2h10]|uniref:Unplaced genomic scaffold scaffold_1451, whole genome shotgun sequence n=1 Tax=Paxillus rubicundulus Ve08.2h10 TaxID=930991 RepID=A0A0D0D744_9AGAM|nr:hypothetical protein PAXRUDRAFT_16314 [Paxillus rubicundulus Ve08.2h10]
MPPLLPGKGGLQSILVSQATSGAVKGSSPSPRTSKGSIPRPFQRPQSSIHSGDIEATSYPLQTGPKFGTWPLPIKEGQGLSLQIEAKDTFGHTKGKIWASLPFHPLGFCPRVYLNACQCLLDPQPGPSSDPTEQIIKGLEVHIASLEKQVERIPDLELQLSSMARVLEALREQVTPLASIGLSPDAETPVLVGTSANGGKSAPSPLHLHMHQQPHLGVEMEDDALGEGSGDNAGPPLPIPPPFTDLVPPIESLSSEPDMELEDVDME